MLRNTTKVTGLDKPLELGSPRRYSSGPSGVERFGQITESLARGMGTPWFLLGMTIFCGFWLFWNSAVPTELQFDPRALNFTLLTLILSLQASYAAPLLLLAQNRQEDRDRVAIEQDRQRAERNLADTEYLAREVVALRLALRDVATRDFVKEELQNLLHELSAPHDTDSAETSPTDPLHGGAHG